jgi:hypothetical protein
MHHATVSSCLLAGCCPPQVGLTPLAAAMAWGVQGVVEVLEQRLMALPGSTWTNITLWEEHMFTVIDEVGGCAPRTPACTSTFQPRLASANKATTALSRSACWWPGVCHVATLMLRPLAGVTKWRPGQHVCCACLSCCSTTPVHVECLCIMCIVFALCRRATPAWRPP